MKDLGSNQSKNLELIQIVILNPPRQTCRNSIRSWCLLPGVRNELLQSCLLSRLLFLLLIPLHPLLLQPCLVPLIILRPLQCNSPFIVCIISTWLLPFLQSICRIPPLNSGIFFVAVELGVGIGHGKGGIEIICTKNFVFFMKSGHDKKGLSQSRSTRSRDSLTRQAQYHCTPYHHR